MTETKTKFTLSKRLDQIPPYLFARIDEKKAAAKARFNQSVDAYANAVAKAKYGKRSFMPETKNPGYAQNPDDTYLPKIIN